VGSCDLAISFPRGRGVCDDKTHTRETTVTSKKCNCFVGCVSCASSSATVQQRTHAQQGSDLRVRRGWLSEAARYTHSSSGIAGEQSGRGEWQQLQWPTGESRLQERRALNGVLCPAPHDDTRAERCAGGADRVVRCAHLPPCPCRSVSVYLLSSMADSDVALWDAVLRETEMWILTLSTSTSYKLRSRFYSVAHALQAQGGRPTRSAEQLLAQCLRVCEAFQWLGAETTRCVARALREGKFEHNQQCVTFMTKLMEHALQFANLDALNALSPAALLRQLKMPAATAAISNLTPGVASLRLHICENRYCRQPRCVQAR
jgi:hypothetical protein